MSTHSYWRLYITIPANGDRDESYTGVAELGMYTNGSGTNLCTGGTAFASTAYSGYPASNAFDGSSSTAWAANGNLAQSIGYHFASPVQVDTISILGRPGADTPRSPKCGIIQFSDNGTDYTDYSYVFGITYSGQTATIPTPVLAADLVLWKLNITAQTGGGYYTAVATVKMLDSGAVDRYVDYNPSASSTYSGAYAAKYALGDLASTYWSAANDTVPQWLQFYTDNASITSYSIQVRPDAHGCPTEWTLSKSTDGGANWTTVDTRTGQTGWTGGETRTFEITNPNYTYDGDYPTATGTISGQGIPGKVFDGNLAAVGSISGNWWEAETILAIGLLQGLATIEGSLQRSYPLVARATIEAVFTSIYTTIPLQILNPDLWSKFKPQPNKFGYQNNKYWSAKTNQYWNQQPHVDDQHIPCGHWHKQSISEGGSGDGGGGESGETYLPYIFWGSCPQVVTIINSEIWFATTTETNPDDLYILGFNPATGIWREVYHETQNALGYWAEPQGAFVTIGHNTTLVLYTGHFTAYRFVNGEYVGQNDISSTIPTDVAYGQQNLNGSAGELLSTLCTWSTIYSLRSTDNGSTWNQHTIDSVSYGGIYFWAAIKRCGSDVFAIIYNSSSNSAVDLYKSTDSTTTWTKISSPSLNRSDYSSLELDIGVLGSALFLIEGTTRETGVNIKKSIDGGLNFSSTVIDTPSNLTIAGYTFANSSSYIYAFVMFNNYQTNVCNCIRVYRSSNGTAWSYLSSIDLTAMGTRHYAHWPISVSVTDSLIAITSYYGMVNEDVGLMMAFWYSTDGGATWNPRSTPFYSHLNNSSVPDTGTDYPAEGEPVTGVECAGPVWPLTTQQNKDQSTQSRGYWNKQEED